MKRKVYWEKVWRSFIATVLAAQFFVGWPVVLFAEDHLRPPAAKVSNAAANIAADLLIENPLSNTDPSSLAFGAAETRDVKDVEREEQSEGQETSLIPSGNYEKNLKMLAVLNGLDIAKKTPKELEDELSKVESFQSEMAATKRQLPDIVNSQVGRLLEKNYKSKYSVLDYREKNRGPPPDLDIVWLGGAGKRTTDFLRGMMHYYMEKEPKKYEDLARRLVLVAIDGISDDGGHIRKLEDMLANSAKYGDYPLGTGDLTVFMSILTDSDAKVKLLTIDRINGDSAEKAIFTNLAKITKAYANDLPKDWNYFCANMLTVARIIDEEWVKTGVLHPESAGKPVFENGSWQNLFYVMCRYLIGEVRVGSDTVDRTKTLGGIYELTGSKSGYALPSSYESSPLAVVLEAAAVKIGGEVILIGNPEAQRPAYYRVLQSNGMMPGKGTPLFATSALIMDKAHEITAEPIELIVDGIEVSLRLNDQGNTVVNINGQDVEVKEDSNDPGKTRIVINRAANELPADANWFDTEVGGLPVSFKSRMVEEQTKITDANEDHVSRVYKAIFRDMSVTKDPGKAYISRSYSVRTSANPQANEEAVEVIRRAKKAIVFGDCSLITSLMPNLMTSGIVEAMKARTDIPRIFIFKIMEDIESRGLSLIDQIRIIERSVQDATGDKTFKFSDICDYAVVAKDESEFSDLLRGKFRDEKQKLEANLLKPETQANLANGKDKYSKIAPEDPVKIDSVSIGKQIRALGITPVWVEGYGIKVEKKYAFEEKALIQKIEEISRKVVPFGDGDPFTNVFSSKTENVLRMDRDVFNSMSLGFSDFTKMLKEAGESRAGVVVIGGNAVLDNAGSISALKEIVAADDGVSVVVWAADSEEESRLKTLGVDRFARVAVGLDAAMKAAGVSAQGKTVLIGSEADFAAVKDAAGVSDIDDYLVNTLKVKAVKLAKPDARNKMVNAMPLVFARAVASIMDDQGDAVKRAAQNMIRMYGRNHWIDQQDAMLLEDLTSQVISMPLVKMGDLSEEVANLQLMYEETLGKL